jgi:hypothetical protein
MASITVAVERFVLPAPMPRPLSSASGTRTNVLKRYRVVLHLNRIGRKDGGAGERLAGHQFLFGRVVDSGWPVLAGAATISAHTIGMAHHMVLARRFVARAVMRAALAFVPTLAL